MYTNDGSAKREIERVRGRGRERESELWARNMNRRPLYITLHYVTQKWLQKMKDTLAHTPWESSRNAERMKEWDKAREREKKAKSIIYTQFESTARCTYQK